MRASLALLTLVTLATGQSDPGARAATYYARPLQGPLAGQGELRLDANDQAQPARLRWVRPGDPGFSSPMATMPFHRSGGITYVGESATSSDYLVSGWGPAEGVLALVHVSSQPDPAITVSEIATLGLLDPLRVCWTDDTLFLIDGLGKRVVAAPWVRGTALPVTFSTVLDDSAHFILAMGAALDLSPATPDGVSLHRFSAAPKPGRRLYRKGSSWSSEPYPPGIPQPTQFALQGDSSKASSFGPLVVSGPAGAFSVIDEVTGSPVASATLAADWDEVILAVSPELIAGHRHRIVAPGRPDFLFTPSVRHGAPRSLASWRMRRGLVLSTHINDPNFIVATRIVRDDTTYPDVLPASLWVAARGVHGEDPVSPTPPVPPGTTAFLNPAATLDFFARFGVDGSKSGIGIPIPISDDPNLEGVVFLFQFVAITPDGKDFVASDVFGTTILEEPAPDGADSPTGAGRQWRTMTREQRERAYAAATAWMARLSKRLPGAGATVRERIQAMR